MSQGIDAGRFRRVLGRVPTAVTVTTADTPNGPVGLVIGSFVSVSLSPPLVGLFVDKQSTSWPHIASAGSFAVNVLGHDQHELCARFARSGGDKFEGLRWTPSSLGHPLLPGATAWIECGLHEVHEIGDHFLAVGRVLDLAEADAPHPLVFHKGTLRVLAATT
ncbi:flavin reductase family protein [Solihabitans fulvus]|uniref:Flavin reductase family protein n=1 Tax=Solihabitans fulvus TaxID=1892852 RepID=A0A5B2WKG8_9PSEU|nr:flavin reductase family protein [Solihabitans fulvus]KAA2252573.1 flavin reductase family protein [Solihabitans fulvus]